MIKPLRDRSATSTAVPGTGKRGRRPKKEASAGTRLVGVAKTQAARDVALQALNLTGPVGLEWLSAGANRHHASVFRGIEALVVLLRARRSLGITQVAKALSLSKSTAHDLLAALVALGFVEQNATTRRYSISPAIFSFLHLFSAGFGQNSALKPLLRIEATRLRVTLVVTALCRGRTYAICASGPMADTFLLGDNGPAYNSACGKILVAQCDEPEWASYAPKPDDAPDSPFANRDPERFHRELRAARVNGVAWSIRERDAALCSVAAPICAGDRPWSRAVGLILPHHEWLARDREELSTHVSDLARKISAALRG